MATPFSQAIAAITTGDETGLRALLQAHPGLVRERAPFAHQATLLHYVAANGVEVQRSPGNAPAIARILLEAGAEADAVAPIYGSSDTTLCLTVTSVHPYLAGVQASLVDVLADHDAKLDGVAGDGAPLGCAPLFGYREAAERLVLRGARVDNLIYAAGLGRTDVVRHMLATGTGTDRIVRRTDDRAGRFSFPVARDAGAREVALIVAAMHGRLTTVRALLDGGVDVNATPYCRQSALHYAAYLGRAEVVEELVARGADTSLADMQTNQTPRSGPANLEIRTSRPGWSGSGERMNVLLFGATGMVGQGVLRECLLDPDVQSVLSIGRSGTGQRHPKLRELIHRDFLDFSSIENELSGFDACFFCLGVSSAGLKEEVYRRVTYDFTMAAARVLARLNPDMTFVYVSGMGTDSSEHSRTMWARVKGKTENALLRLPFKAAYMFRPGAIVPLHGIKSKTRLYRLFYAVTGPLLPLLNAAFPKYVTTTEQMGRAMIKVAKQGAAKSVLENSAIGRVAD